jgi:hypothetical protein
VQCPAAQDEEGERQDQTQSNAGVDRATHQARAVRRKCAQDVEERRDVDGGKDHVRTNAGAELTTDYVVTPAVGRDATGFCLNWLAKKPGPKSVGGQRRQERDGRDVLLPP